MWVYPIAINVGEYCEVSWIRLFLSLKIPDLILTLLLPVKVKFTVRTGFSQINQPPSSGPHFIARSLCQEENSAAHTGQKQPYQQ